MIRRVLLACAAIAILVAALLAVSGGVRVTVGGLRVSARSPLGPSLVAIALLGAWVWLASRGGHLRRDLTATWSALDRFGWTIVIGVAAASAGVAVAFGTFSAAGADASGYLSQAAMWAAGRMRVSDPLSLMPGWPADPGLSVPLGWSASLERGWQVPTYGPGLPLLMAVPHAIGGSLVACLTVAASTAIAVLATSAIAWQLAGAPAAIVAAAALATCPAFILESMQPMSDVPVTAAWMACWAAALEAAKRNRQTADGLAVLAGIACAIAVLIRPNLAPLAIVPMLYLAWAVRTSAPPHPPSLVSGDPASFGAAGFRTLVVFALPVVLAGVFLAWLQWRWYGSPLRSGYGTVEQLYSLANIGANASRYITWFFSTSPLLLIGLLATDSIRRTPATWMLALFAVLNIAAYLAYFVFDEWSYLRFLLPMLAIAAVFTGVALMGLLSRVDVPARAVLLFAAVLALAVVGLWRARALDVFQLADAHRRVLLIDRYLESALPDRAVVVAGEQSGAVRFDAGHAIVRWEAATPDDLSRALAVLEADRRPVWILLDAWEEPLVRAKFPGIAAVALDWPPAVDAGDRHRTRAWSLADRARYLKGDRVVTDRLR